jgi:hypothetical protein
MTSRVRADVERLDILAHDGDGDGRVDLAAHLLDGVVEGQADNRLAVDGGEEVAGLDASAEGGRAIHRGHDFHEAVLRGDFDAEAAVFAGSLGLHVLEVVGVEIAGVRVKRGEHAVDRGFDRFRLVEFGDVVGLRLGDDLGEQLELLEGLRSLFGGVACWSLRRRP